MCEQKQKTDELKKSLREAVIAQDFDKITHATVLLENYFDDVAAFEHAIAWHGVRPAAERGDIKTLRYLLGKVEKPVKGESQLAYHMAVDSAARANPPHHHIVKWLLVRGCDLTTLGSSTIYIDDYGKRYLKGDLEKYARDVDDLLQEHRME
jgi:hypothetical protein